MGIQSDKKIDVALDNLLDRQEYLVTQANELARSFGNLTFLEHKALDFCFSYIKKDDVVDTVYHSSLREVTKHLGLNKSGENYTRVAIALKNLDKKTPLYIQKIRSDGLKSIIMTHLFSYMELVGDGQFDFQFTKKIAPYIFDLKEKYYSFKLRELGRVRSKYTLIMLKLWNANAGKWNDYNQPNSFPPNLYLTGSLEDWESWFLGYNDEDDDEKSIRWSAGRFKSKVLNVALKEISELYPKSNIVLTTKKNGRKVVGYELSITQMHTVLPNNTVVINGEVQPPRNKGKQGVTDKPRKNREMHKIFTQQETNTKEIKRNKNQEKIEFNQDEYNNIMGLWVKTFGINDLKNAAEYLELLTNLYPYDLIMDQITAHKDYAKNDDVTTEMIIDLIGSSLKKAYGKEKPNELSEFEIVRRELARLEKEKAALEQKLRNKPKEVKGLFDNVDLKKSEKQITDNLDKMTGKSPQDWEQTDLF